MIQKFYETIKPHRQSFHPVILFDPAVDTLTNLNFTESNTALTAAIIEDTPAFCDYIRLQLDQAKAGYGKNGVSLGIGGYAEHRTVYSRSRVFDAPVAGEEPRRLHLGTDIWGNAGTAVYAFMDSRIHSFAFNDRYGDYGATLILQHHLEKLTFYTLYGHLSLADISGIAEGDQVKRGQLIAHFGEPDENGYWPPHLHFQVILDMGANKGDHPGVCKFSEREKYLENSPDPDWILDLNRYGK